MNTLKIKTEYIALDAALKFAGVVSTGGEAKILIAEGEISVNGTVCTQRGKKLKPGDRFSRISDGEEYQIQ